ncbi:MAG: alpha/beta fold hydrolase [Acidobacteria bacterium]|nr:alpha/beta fold hydrolase [Acidobacteriota bacterium]
MIAPFAEQSVRGFLRSPSTPSGDALVLTHGAGSNCQSPLLVAVAGAFAEAGFTVLRYDLPFRQARPKGPPLGSAVQDREGLRQAVAAVRRLAAGRVFLGGHSYGGRQASILAASDLSLVDGLLLLAYPLHPPRRPEQLRTSHFPQLQTPALFIHGSRDPFGSPEELRAALPLIPAPKDLLLIEGRGHELSPSIASQVLAAFCALIGATSPRSDVKPHKANAGGFQDP